VEVDDGLVVVVVVVVLSEVELVELGDVVVLGEVVLGDVIVPVELGEVVVLPGGAVTVALVELVVEVVVSGPVEPPGLLL
jgi:hypothetical protein